MLFTLPSLPMPSGSGLKLGGQVTLEAVLRAFYEGLQLATILCCVGAANALGSARRLLRYVPGALYEIGVACVIALTFAPQLVTDAARVRAAHRLRGRGARAAAACDGWRCRCWRARSSARSTSPPRWTPAATGAPPTTAASRAGSPACSSSAGCSACASASTASSTAPPRPGSGLPMLLAGLVGGRRRAAPRRPPSAAAAATAPTRGPCRSGWSPAAGCRRRGRGVPRRPPRPRRLLPGQRHRACRRCRCSRSLGILVAAAARRSLAPPVPGASAPPAGRRRRRPDPGARDRMEVAA